MNRTKLIRGGLTLVLVGMMGAAGCTTAPKTAGAKMGLEEEARGAIGKARNTDPTLWAFLDRAAGYAVFPSVGKGGLGVGGAYGRGILFERGAAVGYCDLTQATIGAQIGGQAYTEIIAFENNDAIETFKQGRLTFNAQATAVALESGAGANAKFTNGVSVFTLDEAGLMAEATVGGQKFTYQPK